MTRKTRASGVGEVNTDSHEHGPGLANAKYKAQHDSENDGVGGGAVRSLVRRKKETGQGRPTTVWRMNRPGYRDSSVDERRAAGLGVR